jgi:serine/threonine protein kinase
MVAYLDRHRGRLADERVLLLLLLGGANEVAAALMVGVTHPALGVHPRSGTAGTSVAGICSSLNVLPAVAAAPTELEEAVLPPQADLQLIGLTPITAEEPYCNAVPNGRIWCLDLGRLLGTGAYGVVHEVTGSCSVMQEAAGGDAGADAADKSTSSSSSVWSDPEQYALKIPIPFSQQVPAMQAQFANSMMYRITMQDVFANESAVLHGATQGQITSHTICIVEFGEAQPPGYEEPYPCLLLELASRGTLAEYVQQHYPSGMPAAAAQIIVRKLIRMVSDFHMASQAIHRDLKPQNVLVVAAADAPLEQLVLKLADCGVAKSLRGVWELGFTSHRGTEAYRPPEGDMDMWGQDVRFDTWSLACILLYLRFNRLPFWYLLEALLRARRPGAAAAGPELQWRWENRADELDNPSSPYAAEGALTAGERTFLKKCLPIVPARPNSVLQRSDDYMYDDV